MKGSGWIVLPLALLAILSQCGSQKKSPMVKDYCNPSGDGTYLGKVIAGSPVNEGVLLTMVNPDQTSCPFKALVRGNDVDKVGVGSILRFQGTMNGPFLSVRELEIDPKDAVGYAQADVEVKRWVLFENMNWNRTSWIQLRGGEYSGERLLFTPAMRGKIKKDGCYRLSWVRDGEGVGVGKCSSQE